MLAENAIAVGVDGSERVHDAVRWAARTAQAAGVPLGVVSSFEMTAFQIEAAMASRGDFEAGLRAEVGKTVDAAVAEAREVAPDIEITGHVLGGHPAKTLIDLSDHVAMVVIGSRGRGALAGSLLGSTSVKVASHSAGSVVVCGPKSAGAPVEGPVVVGVDGSAASDPALTAAMRYAAITGRRVVAVLAWMDESSVAVAGWSLGGAERARLEKVGSKVLREQIARHRDDFPDVRVDTEVGAGQAASALLQAAERERAALTVVGSRGRGGFAGMLLGSTSQAVLHLAATPVLVARPHRHR